MRIPAWFACLILSSSLGAQLTPRNLLQKNCPPAKLKQVLVDQESFHPFPRTVEEWKNALPDSVLAQLVRNGEEALKGEFPGVPATVTLDFSRNGNRTRYENITFGKRNRLWNLMLAESIEKKKRFLDAILDGIWSISEETFWGVSAHLYLQKAGRGLPDAEDPVVDLFAAETAANLALADYFAGEELESISPLIRRRIYYEVNRRVFVPMQSAKYEWMRYGDVNARLNNWAPWIMSNYLVAVLILEKDPDKRIQSVSKALQLTDQYINGFGEDGGCEEGPGYWTNGPGCMLDVLDLLGSASNGQIDIFKEKIIRNMGAYIYKVHIDGNYFVNVADAHPKVNPEAAMVWRFGQAVGDSDLSGFGAWLLERERYGNTINQTFHRTRELFDLQSLKSIAAAKKVFHKNKQTWLPQLQLMAARQPNDLFVAAHGGNNGESHNHNDVGDFIIYYAGDPVIIDVGSGTYTAKTFSSERYSLWFNTSAFHNLPTVNGQQQAEGSSFAASGVSYTVDKARTVLSMNIENAYPEMAGLAAWKRVITSAAAGVTIEDDFKAVKPLSSLTQSFMTVCEAELSKPGTIVFTTAHGHKVQLNYGDQWMASKETMPLVTEDELGLKVTWQDQRITRILLTLRSPLPNGHFKYVISSAPNK